MAEGPASNSSLVKQNYLDSIKISIPTDADIKKYHWEVSSTHYATRENDMLVYQDDNYEKVTGLHLELNYNYGSEALEKFPQNLFTAPDGKSTQDLMKYRILYYKSKDSTGKKDVWHLELQEYIKTVYVAENKVDKTKPNDVILGTYYDGRLRCNANEILSQRMESDASFTT